MPEKPKLTSRSVCDTPANTLTKHPPISTDGYVCTTEVVMDVLLKAAVERLAIEAVCNDFQDLPDGNTVDQCLNSCRPTFHREDTSKNTRVFLDKSLAHIHG